MAKYLGGIEDSNIEIVGISQHFFSSGFDIQYYNYQLDTLAVQKLDIAKSLVKVDMPGKSWTCERNSVSGMSDGAACRGKDRAAHRGRRRWQNDSLDFHA